MITSSYPAAGLVMDSAGNLYGTTYGNAVQGGGVFEVSPSGGGWTSQVIYSVAQGNATFGAGLTMDTVGHIFGTTYFTVFELSPNGNGGWNPTVIHTLTGYPKDGVDPEGTLVLDKAENLYGTTAEGGAKNAGTVYKLSPGKKGKWTEKILYSFKGLKSGYAPYAGIVFDAFGNIYGTTGLGGKFGNGGDGTVFELAAQVGKGTYKEKVLWSFNGTDGLGLLDSLILDSAGNLYGTTWAGGSSGNCQQGCGVVFEITP